MDTTELSKALADVFSRLSKPNLAALEGSQTAIRKALIGFAKEAGASNRGYLIGKAFDENPEFVRDLALVVAASYAGRG